MQRDGAGGSPRMRTTFDSIIPAPITKPSSRFATQSAIGSRSLTKPIRVSSRHYPSYHNSTRYGIRPSHVTQEKKRLTKHSNSRLFDRSNMSVFLQDRSGELARHRHFGYLEHHVLRVLNHLSPNLDQLLSENRKYRNGAGRYSSRSVFIHLLEDLGSRREAPVQGAWPRAVTLWYDATYDPLPARCQRECRGFETLHRIDTTSMSVHRFLRHSKVDLTPYCVGCYGGVRRSMEAIWQSKQMGSGAPIQAVFVTIGSVRVPGQRTQHANRRAARRSVYARSRLPRRKATLTDFIAEKCGVCLHCRHAFFSRGMCASLRLRQ